MALILNMRPDEAWQGHIVDRPAGWIENAPDRIADVLRPRELLGLILMAWYSNETGDTHVGYDDEQPEPNDGLIVRPDETRFLYEQTLVTPFDRGDVMQTVIDRYNQKAANGPNYAENRTLLIFVNQQAQGLVNLTVLRDDLRRRNQMPDFDVYFNQVFTLGQNCSGIDAQGNQWFRFLVSRQYPNVTLAHITISGPTGALLGRTPVAEERLGEEE